MKVFTFLSLAVAAAATTASAQPVKDLVDAQEAVRAHLRDMQPAIEQMPNFGAVLNLYATVRGGCWTPRATTIPPPTSTTSAKRFTTTRFIRCSAGWSR